MMTAKERLEYFKNKATLPVVLIVYLTKDENGDLFSLKTQPLQLTNEKDEYNIELLQKIVDNKQFVGFGDEPHVIKILDSIKWKVLNSILNDNESIQI